MENISPNLPKNTFLWRIVQDHIDEDLFFLGTEFGCIFLMMERKVGIS